MLETQICFLWVVRKPVNWCSFLAVLHCLQKYLSPVAKLGDCIVLFILIWWHYKTDLNSLWLFTTLFCNCSMLCFFMPQGIDTAKLAIYLPLDMLVFVTERLMDNIYSQKKGQRLYSTSCLRNWYCVSMKGIYNCAPLNVTSNNLFIMLVTDLLAVLLIFKVLKHTTA